MTGWPRSLMARRWEGEMKEVLVAARALIAEREHWCQGELAQDNLGLRVPPQDSTAVC